MCKSKDTFESKMFLEWSWSHHIKMDYIITCDVSVDYLKVGYF